MTSRRPACLLGAALLALALAPLAGCSDQRPVSPLLTIEKFDPALGCYAACGAGPAPELNLPHVCPAPAAACGFRGGADQLRVVVDYGDVQFPAATNVTPPVIKLMLDDHEETSTAPIVRVPDSARVHFTSLMLAPPHLVRGLRISCASRIRRVYIPTGAADGVGRIETAVVVRAALRRRDAAAGAERELLVVAPQACGDAGGALGPHSCALCFRGRPISHAGILLRDTTTNNCPGNTGSHRTGARRRLMRWAMAALLEGRPYTKRRIPVTRPQQGPSRGSLIHTRNIADAIHSIRTIPRESERERCSPGDGRDGEAGRRSSGRRRRTPA